MSYCPMGCESGDPLQSSRQWQPLQSNMIFEVEAPSPKDRVPIDFVMHMHELRKKKYQPRTLSSYHLQLLVFVERNRHKVARADECPGHRLKRPFIRSLQPI